MKKLMFPLLLIVLGLTGCKSLSKLTQFDMDYNQSFTIPSIPTPIALPFPIQTPEIQTNSETYFSSHNIDPDLIEKVSLKKLDLTISAPADGDFGFLKTIEISIAAEGQDDVKIAWLEDVPVGAGSTLSMNVSNVDLKAFIMKEKFNLKIKASTDEATTSEYTIDAKTVFSLDANILGL